MISMIRQYNVYTPGAVYSAWGHNGEEALAKVKSQFPEKECSLEDIFDRQDEINELGELLNRALPYLILLQKVRGEADELVMFNGDKGYFVHLDKLGNLNMLIKEICGEDGESDPAMEESLQSM